MHRQRKEKKKEEKAVKREERKAHKVLRESSLTEEERAAKTAMREKRSRERIEHHAAVAKRLKEAEATAPKLVIDLSFWDKMTDGYQRSLVSQLAFSAGCNKKADKPCGMHFTRCAMWSCGLTLHLKCDVLMTCHGYRYRFQ